MLDSVLSGAVAPSDDDEEDDDDDDDVKEEEDDEAPSVALDVLADKRDFATSASYCSGS